jgi:protein-S-isoprenylcysteine O-methyltransferase Ste14
MNNTMPTNRSGGEPNNRPGLGRWLVQTGVFVLLFAASLFFSAGRLDWGMAWLYVGILVVNQVVLAIALLPSNPELLIERARNKGPRDRDRVLAGIMALFGPMATLIVAGLDWRGDGASPIPPALQIVAVLVVVAASLLTIWAMIANRFFYGTLRIETDKGHTVTTTGPYRIVRHPGYAGAILFQLATPFMLDSLWSLIPAMLTTCAIVVRTALEDETLQDKLGGYQEYAAQTRYRLLPGIW